MFSKHCLFQNPYPNLRLNSFNVNGLKRAYLAMSQWQFETHS
ncbi:hypothetical protein PAUR_a2812 [Pseudoalteromonas aurantia 208]|uniref:Orphan protein n=1 Tax=Pseudoalteromonas aurantia 208 TaxID=1314867 RepID=A0ABR9EDI6_9GAMM|nr:hypothetical protein [Pseudoalteromonas aurantia 208]